jgi:hypothetical protein
MFTCSFQYHHWPSNIPFDTSPGEPKLVVQISDDPILFLRVGDCIVGRARTGPNGVMTSPPLPNSMIGILVGDTSGKSLQVAALIFRELDGFYERVVCCHFQNSLCVKGEEGLELIEEDKEEITVFPRVDSDWEGELPSSKSETGLPCSKKPNPMMEVFSKWIREDTVRRKIRLG